MPFFCRVGARCLADNIVTLKVFLQARALTMKLYNGLEELGLNKSSEVNEFGHVRLMLKKETPHLSGSIIEKDSQPTSTGSGRD